MAMMDFEAGRRPKLAIMAPPQHPHVIEALYQTLIHRWPCGRAPAAKFPLTGYDRTCALP